MQNPPFAPLNLPPAKNLQLYQKDNKWWIYGLVRKKILRCTPEEWVRQQLIHYLVHYLGYPKGLIGVEVGLQLLTKLPRRADIVIFNKVGSAAVLIECKAPSIKITQSVFEQAANYNTYWQAPYLIVSNGLQHFCSSINFELKTSIFLADIPHYDAL